MARTQPTTVSAQYLLEGSIYALEQGGLLLRDACALYQSRSYASAIVMALFSREEVGRYKLLRDLRKDMADKCLAVTLDAIKKKCDDHVTKQLRGQFGVTLKSSGDDQIGRLLRAGRNNPVQSPEARAANDELDLIARRQYRQMPHQRNDLRQKCLYVEPTDSGTTWNRPKDQSKQTAREEIDGAAIAYAGAIDRITRVDAYREEDPTFYLALGAWKECPTMPLQVSIGLD